MTTSLTALLPVISFLIVFMVSFLVLNKKELLSTNKFVNLFVAFLIAAVFASTTGAVAYVTTVIPIFAVLLFALVLAFIFLGFIGESVNYLNKPIGSAFAIAAAIIFVVSAIFIFSHLLFGYLPGPGFGQNVQPEAIPFLEWFYSGKIFGAVLLAGVAAIMTWLFVRK